MTLQSCLPPTKPSDVLRGHVLGKFSFPLALTRVTKGLMGGWGGGSTHANSPVQTQPPTMPLFPAERAVLPLI